MQTNWKQLFYDLTQTVVLPGLRRWINTNPKLIIAIAVFSFLLFLAIAANLLLPEKTVEITDCKNVWFYDLNTGELFTAKSELIGPIEAPSGPLPDGRPAGVRAYVFSYSYNPKESELFIGFLEMPDKDASDSGQSMWGQGKLIRRPGDKHWVKATSNRGNVILREIFSPNAKGEVASYYPPP